MIGDEVAKNLLVLTTAGQLKYLKEAIESMQDSLDVLVADDATLGSEIRDFCRQRELAFITKDEPRGLTDSWNRAYQFFREKKYERCILSNDDVRFAKGFSNGLLRGLEKFNAVGPISNGAGHAPFQDVRRFVGISPTEDNMDQIQEALLQKYKESPLVEHRFINGFCFAFSTTIQKFMFSDELLFNPAKINVGNEDDLWGRVRERRGKIAFCRTAYVFHWKAVILGKLRNRNQLWR